MRITDLLDVKSICLDATPASKEEIQKVYQLIENLEK